MKMSRYLSPTLKEDPKDAEVVSHKLMVRGGYIRKVAAGIYNYLPLGLRVIRKFEAIVREEMNKAGAQEVLMPSVVPAELWEESGRWSKYGKELLRIKDRHDKQFCYGPTHEEVITDIVRQNIQSYKQLPLNLYQIQTKFRDEIRPRFGLMRGREFIMKDAYSFHADKNDLDNEYEKMRAAYSAIFQRCGLQFKIVEADTGAIGGSASAEFMVTAQTGEDVIMECTRCGYAANLEAAQSVPVTGTVQPASGNGRMEVSTPGKGSIRDVAEFLNQSPESFVKALMLIADDKPVMVLLRGDHELNEIKLNKVLKSNVWRFADDQTILALTGAPAGYIGPVGVPSTVTVIADDAVKSMTHGVTGANKKDAHYTNVQPGRDFTPAFYADLRNAKEGDLCPKCHEGRLQHIRGIEVGHIFKLGDRYSRAMSATILNQDGKEEIIEMGCYGIGIGRTVAAAIEQNHDANGIIWPMALAPFHVSLILTNAKKEELKNAADALYEELTSANIEVLYDDRAESAGVKFKDAELLGIPLQIIVGRLVETEGKVELKHRNGDPSAEVPLADIAEEIKKRINNAR